MMQLDTTLVRKRLEERGSSVIELCRISGLSYSRVLRALLGGYGVRLREEETRAISDFLERPDLGE